MASTSTRTRSARTRRAGPGLGRRLARFAAVYLPYAGLSVLAATGGNVVDGDALARLANASYAITGYDPHLAAIGFVWGPLPSLLMMPLLPLRHVWEPIVSMGIGAGLVSAGAAAVAVIGFHRLLQHWDLGRLVHGLLLVGLALNPMFLFYAVNGLTESLFLAFLFWATHALVSWYEDPADAPALGHVGVLLGFAYLVRYEALAATMSAAVVVALVSWTGDTRKARLDSASANVLTVGFPSVLSFTFFALSSWLIVGSPFEQFTSEYGNSSSVASSASAGTPAPVWFLVNATAMLAPAIVLTLAVALWRSRSGITRVLAAVAPLAGVAGAAEILQLRGATILSLRYLIALMPLNLIVVALAVSGVRRVVATVTAVALVATAFVSTTWAMEDARIGRYEHHVFTVIGVRDRRDERQVRHRFETEERIADYLDALHLGRGEVLADTLLAFVVVLTSEHPEQFVKPADRPFPRTIADPWAAGVRYVLLPPNTNRGNVDAINHRFPRLYAYGDPNARLVLQFTVDGEHGDRDWRLYQLTGPLSR